MHSAGGFPGVACSVQSIWQMLFDSGSWGSNGRMLSPLKLCLPSNAMRVFGQVARGIRKRERGGPGQPKTAKEAGGMHGGTAQRYAGQCCCPCVWACMMCFWMENIS